MYGGRPDEEGGQHRCLATHPLGGVSCGRAGAVEFRGLRYCEAHAREAEAALKVDLGVRACNLLCRWAEETEDLDDPLLAGLLRDAGREAVAQLHPAEREYEGARNALWRADPAGLPEKMGA